MKGQQQKKHFIFSLNSLIIILIFVVLLFFGLFIFRTVHYANIEANLSEINSINDCSPFNLSKNYNKIENLVEVSWQTKEKCLGYLDYGLYINNLSFQAFPTDLNPKTKHSVTFEVKESNSYYFVIVSEKTAYGINGTPISIFAE